MCENDLLFNPVSRLCDYSINVICGANKQLFKKSDLINMDTSSSNSIVNSDSSTIEPQSTEQTSNPKSQLQNLILYPSNRQGDSYYIKQPSASEHLNIYGHRIMLKCPIGVKNYLYPDREFCNVFHHCHGYSGKVSICDKGQAFDPTANGADQSGVCNFENLVDCTGKFILTESGKRVGQSVAKAVIGAGASSLFNIYKEKLESKGYHLSKNGQLQLNDFGYGENASEELISGVSFDCVGKLNGHYRDLKYCDVFHACISNQRRKSYSCAHLGERTYFDDSLKKYDIEKKRDFLFFNLSINFSFFFKLKFDLDANFLRIIQPVVCQAFFINPS
jgi:hypothetical protein